MLILCPQCRFSREITPHQVPKNAVLATCPKCQTRFRFREKERGELPEQYATEPYDRLQEEEVAASSETFYSNEDEPENDLSSLSEKTKTPSPDQNNDDKKTYASKSAFPGARKQEIDFSLIPWEHPEKFDFFSSFYQTVARVMFHAPKFFSAISKSSASLTRPLFFYMLLRLLQTLMDGMWFMVSFRAIEPSITESSTHDLLSGLAQEMSLPVTLLVTPVAFAIQLYIYSLFFYVMIRLVQPERAKFRTIFRVIAYSAAPTITCVAPIIGSLLGGIWFSITCFIGCKHALNLSWKKTALALAPLYLIAIAIGIQGARQFMRFAG